MRQTNEIQQIEKIREHINKVGTESLSGDEISRIILKLDMLLISVGQLATEATRDFNKAYIFRRFKRANVFKQLRLETDRFKSVKDAELQADIDIKEEMDMEAERQFEADGMTTYYKDIARLVEGLRSRLSYLKTEQEGSRRQV